MSDSNRNLDELRTDLPEVSIVIPIRNEEDHIGECLDSILANDYPAEKLQIIVVDGNSTDGSREIVGEYTERDEPEIRLLDNPEKIVPTAMNIGIDAASGEVIIRVDGHSFVDQDFISTSVKTLLEKKEAEAVGGPVRPVVDEDTPYLQRAISHALDSPMASGSARFSGKSGYVTTVSFGAYRAGVFDRYGNFDERFVRTQDYELNYRMNRDGGKIFMNPRIKSYYYPRSSLKELWSQYFQFGFWKTKVMKKYGELLSLGNLLPPLFVLGLLSFGLIGAFFPVVLYALLGSLVVYLSASVYYASREVKRSGKPRHLPGAVLALVTIHLSFGFGFLKGIFFDLEGKLTLPWRRLEDD